LLVLAIKFCGIMDLLFLEGSNACNSKNEALVKGCILILLRLLVVVVGLRMIARGGGIHDATKLDSKNQQMVRIL